MSCPRCSHAIFNALWGTYKCSIKKRNIHSEIDEPCSDYKFGTPKMSLANEEYETNLEEG